MSFIDTIEIRNFKSIRHQKIEGCKKINVFIGYPNVGKSNILEALSMFSFTDLSIGFTSLVRTEENTNLFHDGNIEEDFFVKINNKHCFSGEYQQEILKLRYEFEFNQAGIGKEEVRSFDLSGLALSSYKSGSVIPGSERLNFIKRYEFIKNPPYLKSNSRQLIFPGGNNIFDILSSDKQLRDEISDLFEYYNLKFTFDTGSRTFKILKYIGNEIFLIPYSLIADTLKRLIFYKAAIKSNQNSVLLFEEPEAHLFPPYIRKFTSDLMFDKSNQFFLNSHSPYLLDSLIEDASDNVSVYLVDYKEGETKIYLLREDDIAEIRQHGVDLFFNIESYLNHGSVNNA